MSSPWREGYFESEATEKMEPVVEYMEARAVRILPALAMAMGGGGAREAEAACC